MKPKVLLLTASYGSGHVIAAKALDEAFREKNIEPTVFDLVLEGGKMERGASNFYEFLMRRGHFIWKLYHDRIMPIRRGDSIRAIYSLFHRKKFFKEIESFIPDIIVSTMDTASLIASLFKKEHPNVKIYTVLTDYVAHPIWVWKNMDGYFVGSEIAQKYLEKHGIEPATIHAYGIPLRSQFTKPISKTAARKKLEIPDGKTVILASAGSFGSIPIEPILKTVSNFLNAYVIILSGKKKDGVALYAGYLKEYGIQGKVLEYADEMNTLMRASDLFISKAGGLTVAECLSCALPAIYVNNFPGHEAGNAEFAKDAGAAVVISDKKDLKSTVGALLADKEKLKEMRKAAEKVSAPKSSEKIVNTILTV